MGSAFHQLCSRYSGTATRTAPTAIRLWETFTFYKSDIDFWLNLEGVNFHSVIEEMRRQNIHFVSIDSSRVAKVREKCLENEIFLGQGKVREFCGWPEKFRKDLESQGIPK